MTKLDWAIRPANAADEAAITQIIHGSGLFTGEEAAGFISMVPGQLIDPVQLWWLAERGAAQGAAFATLDGLSDDVWNLWFIGFDDASRESGGGTALLSRIEDDLRAEHARVLIIETSSDPAQEGARVFYGKRGYREQGRIADYYAPGVAKVIFAKGLS